MLFVVMLVFAVLVAVAWEAVDIVVYRKMEELGLGVRSILRLVIRPASKIISKSLHSIPNKLHLNQR